MPASFAPASPFAAPRAPGVVLSLALFALLALPAVARAQAADAQVRTLAGETLRARFLGFEGTGGLTVAVVGEPAPRTLPLGEIIALRFDRAEKPNARPLWATFTNGDRVALRVTGGNYDQLDFDGSLGPAKVFLDAVRTLEVAPRHPTHARPAGELLEDVLLLEAGGRIDTVRGEIVRVGPSEVVFIGPTGSERSFRYAADGVKALHLADEPAPERSGLIVTARLEDGSTLSGTLKQGGKAPILTTTWGGDIKLPLARVLSLRFLNPDLRWLNTVKPLERQHVPYLPSPWDQVARQSGAARIGSRSFSQALQVPARTKLVYALDGAFERFSALVGVNPATAAGSMPGSVQLKVLVDGEERYAGKLLAGEEAQRVSIEGLATAKHLTIEVDFGRSRMIGATAILGDPLLVAAKR